jgi:hypothetical protein
MFLLHHVSDHSRVKLSINDRNWFRVFRPLSGTTDRNLTSNFSILLSYDVIVRYLMVLGQYLWSFVIFKVDQRLFVCSDSAPDLGLLKSWVDIIMEGPLSRNHDQRLNKKSLFTTTCVGTPSMDVDARGSCLLGPPKSSTVLTRGGSVYRYRNRYRGILKHRNRYRHRYY